VDDVRVRRLLLSDGAVMIAVVSRSFVTGNSRALIEIGNKGGYMAKSIRDVMTSNPKSVEPSATVADAARLMRDEDVGALPVVEGGKLAGIVTDRDIAVRAVAEGKDPQATKVADVVSGDLVTIDPQQDLEEALRLMARHQVRRLPVVEEDGRLVGVVAQADVAKEGADAKTGEVVEEISK
jgi:CBS domain-containing protein